MNTPNEQGLVKKTIWVAPDGFETEDRAEAQRYLAHNRVRELIEEYVSTLDFSNYKPRARAAQKSMATDRVMDFMNWATKAGKVKVS